MKKNRKLQHKKQDTSYFGDQELDIFKLTSGTVDQLDEDERNRYLQVKAERDKACFGDQELDTQIMIKELSPVTQNEKQSDVQMKVIDYFFAVANAYKWDISMRSSIIEKEYTRYTTLYFTLPAFSILIKYATWLKDRFSTNKLPMTAENDTASDVKIIIKEPISLKKQCVKYINQHSTLFNSNQLNKANNLSIQPKEPPPTFKFKKI